MAVADVAPSRTTAPPKDLATLQLALILANNEKTKWLRLQLSLSSLSPLE